MYIKTNTCNGGVVDDWRGLGARHADDLDDLILICKVCAN